MKRNKVKATRMMVGMVCQVGEPLMVKLSRAMNNGEPIEGGASLSQTERKDGVLPQFNIKTDRFEMALDSYDKIAKVHMAQRDNFINPKPDKKDGDNNESPTDSDTGNLEAS